MSESQRLYARLKTRELADIAFPNGETIACEIRDFCPKGLNLQPMDGQAAKQVAQTHRRDETVTVKFPSTRAGKHHILRGKLAHSSAGAFGIYVEDIPEDALRTLIDARDKLAQLQGQAPSDLFPDEGQAILRDCINLFQSFLRAPWDELVAFIKQKVSDRDASPLPLSDHSRYLNGLTDLLIQIDGKRQQHASLLAERMQHIGDIKENSSQPNLNELSIVDEDSFEDWLNISGTFNRIEADNRGAMFQFEQRFSRLMPVLVTPYNDPFGPQAVCLTFQEMLRDIDFNNSMRAVLYRQFGDTLHLRYGRFYEQLNQLLGALKPVALHTESEPAPMPTKPPTPLPEEHTGGDHVTDQVSRLTEIADKLFSLYTQAPATAATSDIQPANIPAPPTPTEATSTVTAPVPDIALYMQQLQQTLGQISGRLPTGTQQPQAETSGLPPHTGGGNNVALLENLLKQFGPSQILTAGASLSDRISRLLVQPDLAEQLPTPLRNELGTMAQLLGRALSEHGAQSDIDRLLKKIEKPIYDIALLGNGPIHLENHPLGRLINLVDRCAVVADDHGRFHDPQLRDLVESILDKGLEQAESDESSLDGTCSALEKLLKHPQRVRRQRVEGYQEICETKGRIRHCNQDVVDELNRRVAGHIVPRVIIGLLELGWQHRLALVKLRDDEGEWDTSLRLLADLMAERKAGSEADAQELVHAIESRLESVVVEKRQLDALMKELVAYLHAPEGAERVQIPESWFKLVDSAKDGAQPLDEGLARQLRVGEWWDIDYEGKPVPMQLIWLSQPPGRACFVNRSADRKQDLTLNELATLIGRGQANPGEDRDLPLLERSEYGTIDAMYRRLVQQATHEPITNLPNRKYFLHHIEQAVHFSNTNCFCVIGFEPYRTIYDHCGIQAGETLTRTLATLAGQELGMNDRLAAIGEGIFAVFLPGKTLQSAHDFTTRLSRALEGYHFQHGGQDFTIHTFFGLAGYQPGILEAAEALRQAVSACDVARSIGPNTIQVYADSDNLIQAQETMESWAGQINEMLSGDRLFLRCQKIAPLNGNAALPYYEVLLGVLDKNGEQLSPQPFVLAVEHWQRAHELDIWVFNQAIAWIRRHRLEFDQTGGFSINLSAQSLSNGALLATLHRELAVGDLPTEKIIFEITETATLHSHAVAQDFMRQIRRYGCRFSLDDFGSGNASFGYLRDLRTDTLKIDGAFIRDMAETPELQAMVRSINEIGHTLGMKTVAEFVASPELLRLVTEIGIDYAQGYEIEKPIHINELASYSEVIAQ